MSKIYEALKRAEQERERTRGPAEQPPVPLGDDGAADGRPVPGTQEEYQRLRASLLSVTVPAGLHTVLVTAPNHGEGATTVAIGLATALGREREARVLLIEANPRAPVLRHRLGISGDAGLTDFIAGRVAPEALLTRIDRHNFSVIHAGEAAHAGAELEMLSGLLTRLRPQFDFIVIDGPPVNRYADVSVIAPVVDGVIMVVEADRTPLADAESATRELGKVGARILGVVLNRRRSYIPAFLESLL
ncbi:CpsD/CapB family tyrosine-protein kinase [Candidatus Binatia bacterium]|nr:CpsD/CapB family tyrosine-protein kinase [Candidatus Binatia bacterium]